MVCISDALRRRVVGDETGVKVEVSRRQESTGAGE